LESNINVVFYQLTIIEVKACGVNKKSVGKSSSSCIITLLSDVLKHGFQWYS